MKFVEQNLADVAAQFATAVSVAHPFADVQAQLNSAVSEVHAVPAPAKIARGTGRHVVAEEKVNVDPAFRR